MDACWATWSVPFDQEEDFTFIASAYYPSPAVKTYWEKKFEGPLLWFGTTLEGIAEHLDRLSSPTSSKAPFPTAGAAASPHRLRRCRKPTRRCPCRARLPRSPLPRRVRLLTDPHGPRQSPVPYRRQADRHGAAHDRAEGRDRRPAPGPGTATPSIASFQEDYEDHGVPVSRGQGKRRSDSHPSTSPTTRSLPQPLNEFPRSSATRISCCPWARWGTFSSSPSPIPSKSRSPQRSRR